jgi:hypothetical protein
LPHVRFGIIMGVHLKRQLIPRQRPLLEIAPASATGLAEIRFSFFKQAYTTTAGHDVPSQLPCPGVQRSHVRRIASRNVS